MDTEKAITGLSDRIDAVVAVQAAMDTRVTEVESTVALMSAARHKAHTVGRVLYRWVWPPVKWVTPYVLTAVVTLAAVGQLTVPGCHIPWPTPPAPAPPPTPPAPPAPISVAGLRVLIVYESADIGKYPKGQQELLYSRTLRDFLNQHCPAGDDGKTKEWRIFDQNVETKNESKLWQDAMARPRASLPWIIVSNGKTGFEGPLPGTLDDVMKLVQKYAS